MALWDIGRRNKCSSSSSNSNNKMNLLPLSDRVVSPHVSTRYSRSIGLTGTLQLDACTANSDHFCFRAQINQKRDHKAPNRLGCQPHCKRKAEARTERNTWNPGDFLLFPLLTLQIVWCSFFPSCPLWMGESGENTSSSRFGEIYAAIMTF